MIFLRRHNSMEALNDVSAIPYPDYNVSDVLGLPDNKRKPVARRYYYKRDDSVISSSVLSSSTGAVSGLSAFNFSGVRISRV